VHPRPQIFPCRRPTVTFSTVLRCLINLLPRVARATVTCKREGIDIDIGQGAVLYLSSPSSGCSHEIVALKVPFSLYPTATIGATHRRGEPALSLSVRKKTSCISPNNDTSLLFLSAALRSLKSSPIHLDKIGRDASRLLAVARRRERRDA
jgi:hypothetical protein